MAIQPNEPMPPELQERIDTLVAFLTEFLAKRAEAEGEAGGAFRGQHYCRDSVGEITHVFDFYFTSLPDTENPQQVLQILESAFTWVLGLLRYWGYETSRVTLEDIEELAKLSMVLLVQAMSSQSVQTLEITQSSTVH